MPSEVPQFHPKPQNKSLEKLKETYKLKLNGILNKSLTVENIETFADEALNDLVALTDDILKQYRNNPSFNPNKPDPLFSNQEQEDDAFKKLDLPNIQEILQRVIQVKESIDSKRTYLNQYTDGTGKIIIPPQSNATEIKAGSGQGIEEKKLIPRLLTLLYILETDFDIKKENLNITEGKVTPDMMRKTPYVRVEILDMGRIVYICDEEGNASYVFDAEKLEEFGIQTEKLDISDKETIKDLIANHPGIGARIIQTKNWRMDMSELLSNPIPEKLKEQGEKLGRPAYEFIKKEKKNFLPFEKFKEEVRNLYSGKGEIVRWYDKERLKHSNWPSAPDIMYKGKGWLSWPELVGKEIRYGKEYLSFTDFQAEVKAFFKGEKNLYEWYQKERVNHSNWPSHPWIIYKDIGWVGFPELVEIPNQLKKEYPSFEAFQTEVRVLYPGEKDVTKWYDKERLNHPNWPSQPDKTYKDIGWVGFPELVGRENMMKKEFLSFKDFAAEVKALNGSSEHNIAHWYNKERFRHPSWPSTPSRTYKNKGWHGWSELVGKK